MKNTMKTGVCLVAIIGCLFGSMSLSFAIPSNWAYDSAYWARTENAFPEDLLLSNMNTAHLTRESLAEILVYAYAKANSVSVDALPAGEPFTDTDNVLIGKAYQAGLMTGVTDIQFSPDTVVSRSTVLEKVRLLLLKMNITPTSTVISAPYSDMSQISSSLRPAVNYLYGLGCLSGFAEGSFQPSTPATVEMGLSLAMRVLKAHNWIDGPVAELSTQRVLNNDFSVPTRTATVLTIYKPSEVNGIRMYYTGLSLTGSQDEVATAHRQIPAIAERRSSYTYEAVAVLTDTLDEVWDGVKKQYDVTEEIYINGSTGAKSSTPIFVSNYIKLHTGKRLMVDFIK